MWHAMREKRTYPKDDGMIKVMEEDIKVRAQVVVFLRNGLWNVFVIFCVEGGRDPSEHPTNRETETKVRLSGRAIQCHARAYSNSLWANIDDGS